MRGTSLVTGLVLLALLPLAAQADPGSAPTSKFYVGLDVGSSRLDATVSQQFFGPEVNRPSGHAIGFQLRGGVQISRYFGIELGYADFGSFEVNDLPYNCPQSATPPCTYNFSSRAGGPFGTFVGTIPFAERFAFNARLGGYYADMSSSERDPDRPETVRKDRFTGMAFQYGVALSYQLNPRMKLSLNWNEYDLIAFGPSLGGDVALYDSGSYRLTSLGFAYRF